MKKIFYGWWIVLASFLTLFVCAGIGFFSFPVFLRHIADDTQWGIDKLSTAGAISSLAAGFFTPAIGYAVDRYGARSVMLPGAVLIASSFLLMGRITSINQMYILFMVAGIGMAGTTILPTHTLVARWFEQKRGRAMGIVTMGGGIGGMVWMPVVNRLIESQGWRNAYAILGVIVAAVSLPVILFVIRSTPASMGLTVDGEPEPISATEAPDRESRAPSEQSGYDLPKVLRTSSFWLIFCASFFGVFSGSGFGLHIIAFLSKSGLTSGEATIAWSATIGASIAGRVLFGYLSENRQKRYFAASADLVRTISILMLVLLGFGILPLGAAVAQLVIFYGLFLGCSAVMSPLLLSETFGVKAFGKIMGVLGIPFTIGMALGQVAGGYLYNLYQNYNLAFGVFAATLIVAGIAVGSARPLFLLEGRAATVDTTL